MALGKPGFRGTSMFLVFFFFFRHFMQADANKFNDVWCMNEEECKELVTAVLEGDRIVHTQQLGLEWQQPDL